MADYFYLFDFKRLFKLLKALLTKEESGNKMFSNILPKQLFLFVVKTLLVLGSIAFANSSFIILEYKLLIRVNDVLIKVLFS